MGRLAPDSELCILHNKPHRRDPNSLKGYIYSDKYVPGPCLGGEEIITGTQAKDYSENKPIRFRCPGGCGNLIIARKP